MAVAKKTAHAKAPSRTQAKPASRPPASLSPVGGNMETALTIIFTSLSIVFFVLAYIKYA